MKELMNELLHVKELTAFIALMFGFGLSAAGFMIDPAGVVDDSVLWILGQCFIYAGSIYGISTHYSAKQKKLEERIEERLSTK